MLPFPFRLVTVKTAEMISITPTTCIQPKYSPINNTESKMIHGLYRQSTMAVRPAPNRFRLLKNRVSASPIPMIPLKMSRP